LTKTSFFSLFARPYQERLACAEECFTAYELLAPHHRVAAACVHAACSGSNANANGAIAVGPSSAIGGAGESAVDCFRRCAEHVARRVDESDWPRWALLLSEGKCGQAGGDDAGNDKAIAGNKVQLLFLS
jgi:hypothetical protein